VLLAPNGHEKKLFADTGNTKGKRCRSRVLRVPHTKEAKKESRGLHGKINHRKESRGLHIMAKKESG